MNKKLFLLPVAMMLLASCTTPKPTPVPPEPDHDGETVETAFTAAEAIEAGKALGVQSGGSTDSKYYIKDVILGQYKTNPLFSLSYGNSTYEIGSADAKFVAFQVKKLVDGEIKNIVPTDPEAELQVGDTVCVYSKITLYVSQSSGAETWETTDKGSAAIASYSFGANHVTPERGAVEGTKSVSEALELLPANKDEFLWKTYNVTGKVTGEVKTNTNDSSLYQFDIADLNDSTKKGTVYNVPLASGVSVPTPGDTVVVSDIYILNFSNKLEFMLGKITSVVEGEPDPEPQPTDPVHAGTQADPYTAADAIAATNNKVSGVVYIQAIISSIANESSSYNADFGNKTFFMSDDGTTTSPQFEAFRVKWGDKDTKMTEEQFNQLTIGAKVLIAGELATYNGQQETKSGTGYVVAVIPAN